MSRADSSAGDTIPTECQAIEVCVADALGDAVAAFVPNSRFAEVIREGLLIGGWVAMWRPLEVFLYDWWPIRAEAHLSDRLSTMPVRIEYTETGSTDAWRGDWPALSRRTRDRRTREALTIVEWSGGT